MANEWNKRIARDDIDTCRQDLFEARLKLSALEADKHNNDKEEIEETKDKVLELENELSELLEDWALHTRRKYYPKYTEDWRVISREYREAAGWTCNRCGANLFRRKRLLHVHHKNGKRKDNRNANLEVLCALYHSAAHTQFNSGVSSEDIEYIHNARPRKPHK